MQREEIDVVRQLFRLFLAYERIEALAAAERLPSGEQAALVPALGDLSQSCWRGLFGPALDTPPHRRFVLGWCLRNAELLMKEQVLPVIAHQVVAGHIQSRLGALPETEAGYDFSQEGPQGQAGTALRRVYLIQSLTILLARLAAGGQIPSRLQAHLTRHLVTRVKALFVQAVESPDELSLERLPDLAAMLADFRLRGLIAPDLSERLERADEFVAKAGRPAGADGLAGAPSRPSIRIPMSGSVAGADSRTGLKRPAPGAALSSPGLPRPLDPLSSSGSRTPAIVAAPQELVDFAAAGELIRRLRRHPSLAPEDRDRLTKRVETEMEDLLAQLGEEKLERALAALGERLGIPVPPRARPDVSGTHAIVKPPPLDHSASRLLPTPKSTQDVAAQTAGQPRTPDSSDYQWAFDLIDDLRRESVEPEGSSGK